LVGHNVQLLGVSSLGGFFFARESPFMSPSELSDNAPHEAGHFLLRLGSVLRLPLIQDVV
jgi:hypothetical protein